MLRASLCAVTVLALLAVCMVQADDKAKGTDKDKQHSRATITKVDTQNGTITVRMKDKQGKETERTFQLARDIVYLDSTGNAARIDVFRSGDEVLVLEQEGKLKELRKGPGSK